VFSGSTISTTFLETKHPEISKKVNVLHTFRLFHFAYLFVKSRAYIIAKYGSKLVELDIHYAFLAVRG